MLEILSTLDNSKPCGVEWQLLEQRPHCYNGRTMAKRRTKKKSVNQHKEPRESFHLPKTLQDSLKKHIGRQKPKPNKSEVLRTALEKYLTEEGDWPPAREEE